MSKLHANPPTIQAKFAPMNSGKTIWFIAIVFLCDRLIDFYPCTVGDNTPVLRLFRNHGLNRRPVVSKKNKDHDA